LTPAPKNCLDRDDLMTSIIKKKIRGRYYYYAVESKRVDGKPRIVWQKYLGKVNDIVMAMTGLDKLPVPQSSRIYDFGAEAALLAISRRLDVAGIVNKHLAWQGEGLSAGESMLLHTIYSTVSPGIKLSQWFDRTMLRRYFNISSRALSEKRFQGIVALLTPEITKKIQRELAQKIVEEFGLRPEALVYSEIKLPPNIEARPGKKNSAPLYVNALITREFSIPLFHKLDPGEPEDEKGSAESGQWLIDRYCALGYTDKDVTVVLSVHGDAVNPEFPPSREKTQHRYIVELPPGGQEEDFPAVPLERFYLMRQEQREKIRAYRTSKKIDEKNVVALLIYNETNGLQQPEGPAAGQPNRFSGKKILMTDNIHWDNEEIYDAYFGRKELEEAFMRMNARPGARSALKSDRHTAAYVFCLMLALTMQSLMRWELYRCGVTGSIPEILKQLSEIREVAVTYAIGESQLRKKEHVIIAELSPKQKEIFDCLHLKQFTAGGGSEDKKTGAAVPACQDGGDQE
jgi:hypothetical protein